MESALSIVVASPFTLVVFGAVAVSLVMSLVFLLGKGSLYDQIGEGGLTGEGEMQQRSPDGAPASAQAPGVVPGSPAGSPTGAPAQEQGEREQEIRQLLQARSERLVRRGEPALDIDAEVARLTAAQPASAPQRDQEIVHEVLQLVVARNERRERQGLQPLDIEAEVERTLTELGA